MPLKEKDYTNDEGLKDKSLLLDDRCTCNPPLRNISECEETGEFATKCVLCNKEIWL